ncbi:DmpA family aminopeptidase [Aliikangiella sp. IMCC44359]|uniref:DmpA family aminopeptidase n=1 Tax=Aliikangiella sp. IMCC44359 TaxID=3459125 RepID=UPI00403AD60E
MNSKINQTINIIVFIFLFLQPYYLQASDRERARDLGIVTGHMKPGKWNAITDVPGVMVGQVSLIDPSKNMHTGITAILPHAENLYQKKVPAGFFQANGYGKMMGTTQVIELGELETPILLTNTLNVAESAAGIIEWTLQYPGNEKVKSVNAIVGETNDGRINQIRERYIRKEDAIKAIKSAKTGRVDEGNVGAGSGTVAFGFKAGIGTASRQVDQYHVGVLVQANYGGDLHIAGIPVGRKLKNLQAQKTGPDGSIMIVIATDAPISDRNLNRLAKRAILGVARTGGVMSNGSGDYVLAFSTAKELRRIKNKSVHSALWIANNKMTPFFEAVIEATEEAVYNSLFAAKSVGKYSAIPKKKILSILKKHQVLKAN